MADPFHKRHSSDSNKVQAKKFKLDEKDILANHPYDVHQLYENNWKTIQTQACSSSRMGCFAFLHHENYHKTDWDRLLNPIFIQQQRRFKIYYSHHFILGNKEANVLRFFCARQNNAGLCHEWWIINLTLNISLTKLQTPTNSTMLCIPSLSHRNGCVDWFLNLLSSWISIRFCHRKPNTTTH